MFWLALIVNGIIVMEILEDGSACFCIGIESYNLVSDLQLSATKSRSTIEYYKNMDHYRLILCR